MLILKSVGLNQSGGPDQNITQAEMGIGLVLSQFESRVPVKPVLGEVGSVTLLHMDRLSIIKSAIFISLMCSLLPEDLHSEVVYFLPKLLLI